MVIQEWVRLREEMRADPTMIDHLYLDKGLSIRTISRVLGRNRATIYRRLEATGAYKGPGKGGPARKTHCTHGHDLDEWGVEIPKERGGGRYCRKCKQIADRAAWRRRNAK